MFNGLTATAYRYFPERSVTIDTGVLVDTFTVPRVSSNGEPGIGVSAPLLAMVKPEKVVSFRFAAYRNLPLGSIVKPDGFAPAANGDPGTGARLPLELTVKADTPDEFEFATNSVDPDDDNRMLEGLKVVNGEPETS